MVASLKKLLFYSLVLLIAGVAFLTPNAVSAQTELVVNGGFETGNLAGWSTQVNFFFAPPLCIPGGFAVVPTGYNACDIFMQPAQPLSGNFVALSDFESQAGGQVQFFMYQDVAIPAGGTVDFTFSYRVQYYSQGSWFLNRFMEARIMSPLDPIEAVPLEVLHRFDTGYGVNCTVVTPGPGQFCEGTVQNTGWVTVNADLSAYAGQTIRLLFYQQVPTSLNGPALLEYDEISIVHTPTVTTGITVTESGGSTDIVEGGATDTFNVELTTPPLSPVSINIVTDGQCTVAPNPVIFAAGEVGPIAVTVTAVDDALIEGPHTCAITLQPAISADLNYNGIDPADVTANITDNDIAAITVDPVIVNIVEGGATDTFDITLDAPPTAQVSITLAPDAQCTVAPNPVIFAAGEVGPATVTVTAVDDDIAEGPHTCDIVLQPAVSADANYNGIDPADVTANVTDNDVPGAAVNPTALIVRENGPSRTYNVVLAVIPPGGETVTITPTFDAAQITVIPASLQFDNTNWNIPQQFTVTAVDNAIVDGQRVRVITHTVTSTGPIYDGAPAADVTVTIRDDDGGTNGGGTDTASQPEFTGPPVPLCADLTGTISPVVRAAPPPGVYYGVHCRIIAESNRFIRTAAEVGVQSVLERGVIHAVDVFSPGSYSAANTTICLQGPGDIIFLDAAAVPRTAQPLPASYQGGYTCAIIPGVGTVVLVTGTGAAPIPANPANNAASITLNGCQVTTFNAVRLRSEPNANSAIITTLPYDTTYTATAYVPGWYRLIYADTQGWTHESYLSTHGNCG